MSLRKNRSEPESEGWRCVDCDEADDLAPMFQDEVWHRMGTRKRDVLRTGCARGRLGRTIHDQRPDRLPQFSNHHKNGNRGHGDS